MCSEVRYPPALITTEQTPEEGVRYALVVTLASVSDLHVMRFDQVFAKNGHALLRYTAEGSHVGKPYNGIEATGKHAMWSAAAIVEGEDGEIRSFTKDWGPETHAGKQALPNWLHVNRGCSDWDETDSTGLGAGH